VSYRDHGAGILLEKALQPRDRLGVKMVGRLVEDQHVRRREQQLAQCYAPAFAAGQGFDLAVPRRQSQSITCHFERAFQLPAVARLDRVLQFRLLFQQGVHLFVVHWLAEPGAHFLEALEQRFSFGDALFDVPANIAIRVQVRLLGQVADANTGLRACFTVVLGIFTGHDFQQSRFARAVVTQDADFRTREKTQADVA